MIIAVLTIKHVVANATDQNVITRTALRAVAAGQVIIAVTAFNLVITAHTEHGVVTSEAAQQITRLPAGQLLTCSSTFDESIKTSRHIPCSNNLSDTCSGKCQSTIGLHIANGFVTTEKVIQHPHRLLGILIDQDQQVVAIAGEGQARFIDTAAKEHPVIPTTC
ncbi:hypothetical protein D0N87_27520, partial [Pseudomonas sp. ATCC 13867]